MKYYFIRKTWIENPFDVVQTREGANDYLILRRSVSLVERDMNDVKIAARFTPCFWLDTFHIVVQSTLQQDENISYLFNVKTKEIRRSDGRIISSGPGEGSLLLLRKDDFVTVSLSDLPRISIDDLPENKWGEEFTKGYAWPH